MSLIRLSHLQNGRQPVIVLIAHVHAGSDWELRHVVFALSFGIGFNERCVVLLDRILGSYARCYSRLAVVTSLLWFFAVGELFELISAE